MGTATGLSRFLSKRLTGITPIWSLIDDVRRRSYPQACGARSETHSCGESDAVQGLRQTRREHGLSEGFKAAPAGANEARPKRRIVDDPLQRGAPRQCVKGAHEHAGA